MELGSTIQEPVIINLNKDLYIYQENLEENIMKKHTISVAPMMDITYSFQRVFMRMLTKKSVLWSEMIHENAILHHKDGYKKLLHFYPIERPLVLQLGGNEPSKLAQCAKYCQEMGYDEINLNCGCPSPRVTSGAFGACLMLEPELVAECLKAIKGNLSWKLLCDFFLITNLSDNQLHDLIVIILRSMILKYLYYLAYVCRPYRYFYIYILYMVRVNAKALSYRTQVLQVIVEIPVTVKCRLGVDYNDDYDFIKKFVTIVNEISGVTHFVIHARKAFLKGLNPAQNRNVPPLMYDRVIQLKKDFPHLEFSINGGFTKLNDVEDILNPQYGLVGCMMGRAAFDNPWMFCDIDRRFYNCENPGLSRREILIKYAEFADQVQQQYKSQNVKLSYPYVLKPIMNLFNGEKQSIKYRRFLSDAQYFNTMTVKEMILQSVEILNEFNKEALDQKPPLHKENILM